MPTKPAFKPQPVPAVTMYGLARHYIEHTKGDTLKAAATMIAAIQADPALLASLVDDAVTVAAKLYVNSVTGNKRTAIMASADNVVQMTGMTLEAATAFAGGMKHCLMDFPLRGGLKLRHATTVEIAAQAAYYEKSSATDALRGRWLRLVEHTVPAGQKAGKVLTETKLQKLFEEAQANA